MAFDGAGFGRVDPDTRALRAAMTVPPPPGRLWVIDQTIRQLKQHGIWQKLDVLWMLAAHDAQAARLNWKAPASFALTAVNSPTFTADRGYAGDGATSYLNTGWDPGTNGSQFTRNDASMGVWSRTDNQSGFDFGSRVSGPSSQAVLACRTTIDQALFRINTPAGSQGDLSNANGSGWFVANRPTGGTIQGLRNNVSLGTGSVASDPLTTFDGYIGALNQSASAASFSTKQLAAAFYGASQSAAFGAAFYSIVQTYMNRLGA